jgi:hypothetical protein
VRLEENDHLLLYTDGVSETLADDEGRAERRLAGLIDRAPDGGAALLDAILGELDDELAGREQPDDFTMLTASMPGASQS